MDNQTTAMENTPKIIKAGFEQWWKTHHHESNAVPFEDGDSVRAFADAKFPDVIVCEYEGNEASGAIIPAEFLITREEAKYAELDQRFNEFINDVWGAIYGDEKKTQWEYPGQVIRHLQIELGELRK